MPCRGSGNPRDSLYRLARAAGIWMRSLDKSLRRCLPAQWRREPQLTEMPAQWRCEPQLTEMPAQWRREPQLTEMPDQWRREQELTETPTRSMALRTTAYGDARSMARAREQELTEMLTRSMASRTIAYGNASLLNSATHMGCWGRLKSHPRRIPHPSVEQWYNLSDPQMEEALGDRISFRRFVGLGLQDETPDYSTISRFRTELVKHGLSPFPTPGDLCVTKAGGATAHAKPDPPLKEGARQDKTIRPHRRADAGVRGPAPPLQNTNDCAIVPP